MNKLTDILFFVLVFLLQVIITDYLHLGPYVYLCLIPFLVLCIPLSRRPQAVLLAAFGMGLMLDLLSDGVAGLNAGAAVAAAASRRILYRTLVNRDRQDQTEVPVPAVVGLPKYLKYAAAVTAVYMVVYVLFDCISFRPAGFILLKIVASTAISTALGLLLVLSLQNRR
jgi:hypothetical protein